MGEEFTADERKAIVGSLEKIFEALERQEAAILELKFWIRLGRQEQAKELFDKILDSPKKKWVYELLDGKTSLPEIEKRTGVNPAQSSPWGQEWEARGIVVDVGGGTRRKVIPLSALGIKVPPFTKKKP
jgi:hypothetical protein